MKYNFLLYFMKLKLKRQNKNVVENKNINYIICFIIFLFIMIIVIYIVCKLNRIEGMETEKGEYSKSVDIPIVKGYSCKNMCSSQSKCYITGGNCTSDGDCEGCNPRQNIKKQYSTKDIIGNDDAGKYDNISPNYSTLTTDISKNAMVYLSKTEIEKEPVNMEYGYNIWKSGAELGTKINKLNSKYKWGVDDTSNKLAIRYKEEPSMTGIFKDNGPTASNAILH